MKNLNELVITYESIAYDAKPQTAGALLDQYVRIKSDNDPRPGLYINRTPGAYAILDRDNNTLILNQYVVDNPDLKANGESTGIKLSAILNLLVSLANNKGWDVTSSDTIGDVTPNPTAVYNNRKTQGFTGSSILD